MTDAQRAGLYTDRAIAGPEEVTIGKAVARDRRGRLRKWVDDERAQLSVPVPKETPEW